MSEAIKAYVQTCLKLSGKVKKDAENPHFKSGYVTLESVLATILPVCHENKIVPLQEIIKADPGIAVKTTIYHESGDKLELDPMPIPVDKNHAQGVVSASTYGRRVSLMAIFGLAPSDDDGNAATAAKPLTEDIDNLRESIKQEDWIAVVNAYKNKQFWLYAYEQFAPVTKGLAKKLLAKGEEYADLFRNYKDEQDSDAAIQLSEELSPQEKRAVWALMDKETQDFVKSVTQQEAA